MKVRKSRMNIRWAYGLALLAIARGANGQTTTVQTTAAATTPSATDTATPAQTTSNATPSTTQPLTTPSTSNTSPTQTQTQTSTSLSQLPNLSSSTTNTLPHLTLPSITQDTGNVPTYQVVIPNLAGNPFLATSSYPDGTVFIIVGSCLAGVALILIGWRVVYSYLLHRQTQETRKKTQYPEMHEPYTAVNGSPKNFSVAPFARDISMDFLRPSPGDRKSVVSTRPSTGRPATAAPRPPSTAGNPLAGNLFYSPSAHPGATTAAAIGTQSSDRNSAYLPAGYYLRESGPATGNAVTSARTGYNSSNSSSMFIGESSAPIPRLTRSTTGTSASTLGNGNNGRNQASVQGSVSGRPMTMYQSTSGVSQGYVQTRRPVSIAHDPMAGDRKSKPSQVLDELLGGRI
jgi:hypothetical protein